MNFWAKILALFLCTAAKTHAQEAPEMPAGIGAGTYLGVGPGGFGFYALSLKKWVRPSEAVDGAIGAYFDEFYSHVDYRWRRERFLGFKGIPWEVGAGVSTFVGDQTWVGLRGTLGTSRFFMGRYPRELFIEFTPSFFLTPERIVEAALGFGGRVYF